MASAQNCKNFMIKAFDTAIQRLHLLATPLRKQRLIILALSSKKVLVHLRRSTMLIKKKRNKCFGKIYEKRSLVAMKRKMDHRFEIQPLCTCASTTVVNYLWSEIGLLLDLHDLCLLVPEANILSQAASSEDGYIGEWGIQHTGYGFSDI